VAPKIKQTICQPNSVHVELRAARTPATLCCLPTLIYPQPSGDASCTKLVAHALRGTVCPNPHMSAKKSKWPDHAGMASPLTCMTTPVSREFSELISLHITFFHDRRALQCQIAVIERHLFVSIILAPSSWHYL